MPSLPDAIHSVTFDCWSTLIHELPSRRGSSASARAQLLSHSLDVSEDRARAAFAEAWREHQRAWHRREVFAAPHMLQHVLHALAVQLEAAEQARLLAHMEQEILARDVQVIDGASEVLRALRARGIRTALICDTGFTPGRVVRSLLAQHGLLPLLEVCVFSEEVGVPKPHARAFASALEALGVGAAGAVHVGDLRRSDVAGARAAGMGSVRFRGHHDDADAGPGQNAGIIDCVAAGCTPPCERPEADVVVNSFADLLELLTPRLRPAS